MQVVFDIEFMKFMAIQVAQDRYDHFLLEETESGYTIFHEEEPVFYDGILEYLSKYSLTWEKFMESRTTADRMKWCGRKARTANKKRFRIIPTNCIELQEEVFKEFIAKRYKKQNFDSALEFRNKAPMHMIKQWDNWESKALKDVKEPYQPKILLTKYDVWKILERSKGKCYRCGSIALEGMNGSWGKKGNRIGTLEHIVPLNKGGDNNLENLTWSCIACNVNI